MSRKTHSLRGVEGLEEREVPATTGLTAPVPTAAALTATVAHPSSYTVLLPSGVTLKYGESVTLTAAVLPASAGASSVTGTVSFKDGSTTLATLTLSNSQASFTTTKLLPGTHHITAVYNGGNYAASSSPTKTLTVSGNAPATTSKAGTVTSLSASRSSASVGQSVTLTASVRASSGTPSGTVTFRDGSTVVGTATLSGGVARLTVTLRTAGTHNFTASYGGASSFSASADTSPAVVTVRTATAGTVTSLAATPTVITVGQAVTLTASVRATVTGLAAPNGTVTFRDGSHVLGTAALSGGVARLTVRNLTVGSHSLTASYSGASGYGASSDTSPAVISVRSTTPTPSKVGTVTTLAASSTATTVGHTVSLTVSVRATVAGKPSPTGTVTFRDGSTVVGTAALSGGVARLPVSLRTAGTHRFTATYSGSGSFSASADTTPAVVTVRSTTPTPSKVGTVTSLAASSTSVTTGQTVTLTASVRPTAAGKPAPTGTVTFRDGTRILGLATLASGVARLVVSHLTAGIHNFTASYSGASGYGVSADTSPAVVTAHSTTVTPHSPTGTPTPPPPTQTMTGTTTTVAVPSGTVAFGQAVTLTAAVRPKTAGKPAPTGWVTFKDGTRVLGSAALSNGVARLSLSNLTPGTHHITASFAGSAHYGASSDTTPAVLTISRAAAKVDLSLPTWTIYAGHSLTINVRVTTWVSSSLVPHGTVTLKNGSTVLGTLHLDASGHASLTLAHGLSRGTHTITAVYGGGDQFTPHTVSETLLVH